MANIISSFQKGYTKTTKTFNQVSLIFIIVGFGALILFYINNNKTGTTDNTLASFKCPLTPLSQEVVLDTAELKTNTQLAIINFDTEVYKGSASKNSIPALTGPTMVDQSVVANCIPKFSEVIVVQVKNEVRIYPRMLLNYHVAINDQIGDEALIITYSPLSGHYQVYNRKVKNEPLVFGVSGFLYRNSDLLFDTRTETLWSQYTGKALVGSLIGASLNRYPFQLMAFSQAQLLYPTAKVTSFETGFHRNYGIDPFADYLSNSEIIAPQLYKSNELGIKTQVIGFTYSNQSYAFAFSSNIATDNTILDLGTTKLTLSQLNRVTQLSDKKKQVVPFEYSLWFAWKDFNPDTKVIK